MVCLKNLFCLSTKSFVHHTIQRCSTQMYHALKGQHFTFSTHYQPYPHHTPNAMDLLPKWPHGSKIQKSRKVDFFDFFVRPIEISIDREISSRLYHSYITRSYALDHALSNALSTMVIRPIEKIERAFKVAHKNEKK